MEHVSHTINDLETLSTVLTSAALRAAAEQAQSTLVQVYSARSDPAWIRDLATQIMGVLPNAVVVGATTVGEIAHGHMLTGQTVVGFTFFASSNVTAVALSCPSGQETQTGTELGWRIDQVGADIAGVLLLATPASLDAARLLRGLEASQRTYPVFGGGAADYATMAQSLVFFGTDVYSHGAVAVVLTGADLHVEVHTHLGWRPLSKEMTITEVDGMLVKKVDGKPAFELYQRYLDIPDDGNFFLNAIEFPFLLQRQGNILARVPVAVGAQGGVQFIADVAAGDRFRIGYGDPDLIIADAVDIQRTIQAFAPQAVFLYTCSCRRFLMQQDVELETLPFEAIAPTFGFYTYGEFFGPAAHGQLLNATMVAVGLREDSPQQTTAASTQDGEKTESAAQDPFAHKHARIISRLMHFIQVVTEELEQTNRELTQLSLTDHLTQIYNRVKLDAVLAEEMARATRYKYTFSVILLDIDHFKQVNDTHGHIVGDAVLVRLACVLKKHIRENDTLGRWGGEEFLLILPHTDLEQACALAEKLRQTIEAEAFQVAGYKTCSFGITSYCPGDNMTRLLARADHALYEAKNLGRNRVQVQEPSGRG